MTKKSFPLLAFSLVCLCLPQATHAAQYPMECAEISGIFKMADAVVKATADKIEVKREIGNNIFTTVHFTADEYIKGSGEKNFKFHRMGGTLGGVTVSSDSDLPPFTEGQKGYLFLTQTKDAYYPTCDRGFVDQLPDAAATEK